MRSVASERADLPFVSVIIPVYNDAERLATCLEALESQAYPSDRFEVLVVDNGSSEDIGHACQAFDHVRLLHETKPGSYAARNKGIATSEAQFLAFTDSDCIPHRDWLENGVMRLMATPECDIVGGNVIVFFSDSSKRTAAELYESARGFPQQQRIDEHHWSVTANLFVHRSVYQSVGPFDGELRSGGDAEWCKRAHSAGHRIAYAEDARVDHPARASLRELLTKARRVGGGAHMSLLKHDASLRYLARYVVRSMYHSGKDSVRVLTGDGPKREGTRRYTMLERMKIAIVLNLFTACRLTEVVRLRLTRGSPRRS